MSKTRLGVRKGGNNTNEARGLSLFMESIRAQDPVDGKDFLFFVNLINARGLLHTNNKMVDDQT